MENQPNNSNYVSGQNKPITDSGTINPQFQSGQQSVVQIGSVETDENKFSKRRHLVVRLGFVMALAILAGGVYFGLRYMEKHDVVRTEQEQARDDKDYTERGKEFIDNHKTEFFKPSGLSMIGPTMANFAIKDTDDYFASEAFSYALVGSASGDTNTGDVRVTQIPASDSFNPPVDCGPFPVTNLILYNTEPLPCKKVVERSSYTGYLYDWQDDPSYYTGKYRPPVYRLLFAKINSTIIGILGVGVPTDELIGYMDSMIPINHDDIPEETHVVTCNITSDKKCS